DGEPWPIMNWKSSVALLPVRSGPPLIVSAGGRGTNANQTASYGVCTPGLVQGFVGAFDRAGQLVWGEKYPDEGNIRASCAVADLDGDGNHEVIVPFGCKGKVRCYGVDDSGNWGVCWTFQLGDPDAPWTQRSIASP